MKIKPRIALIQGQPSYILATRCVRAAITLFGGMLGPVMFYTDESIEIQPYSIAPWAEEPKSPSMSSLLAALRGDFVCSAFGDNAEAYEGRAIPPHGDTANSDWVFVQERASTLGVSLRVVAELRSQGGSCVATTVLLENHPFVYQRHDFHNLSGPINPGHHAMLRCPPNAPSAVLSFSAYEFAYASPSRSAFKQTPPASRFLPDTFAASLNAMMDRDGKATDAAVFPGPDGVDDVLMVCARQVEELAWSAATFPDAGYAWISLRTRVQLPSTLIWLSNGGRLETPWSGRHIGVIGVEDIMGYFASGLAESARDNALTARGISTCMRPASSGRLEIPYIQGCVRIPPGFDRVASVEPTVPGQLLIRAASGATVRVACRWEFLADGRIPELCAD